MWSEDIVSVEQSFPLGYAEPETPPSPPTKVQVDPQTKISPLRTSPISSPEDNSWGEANEEQKIDDPLCELYQNLFLPCFLKTYHRTEDSSGSSSYYDVNSPVEFPGPKLYLPGQSLLPTWVKKKSS